MTTARIGINGFGRMGRLALRAAWGWPGFEFTHINEERPLVSVDYKDDLRSGVVDALSTRMINGTQVRIYAWYGNEWGYASRLAGITRKVADSLEPS